MRNLIERYGSENLILNLLFKKILLVSERDLSKHILKDAPTSLGYVEGALKKNSMAFLAPHALTISHDEQLLCDRLAPDSTEAKARQCLTCPRSSANILPPTNHPLPLSKQLGDLK